MRVEKENSSISDGDAGEKQFLTKYSYSHVLTSTEKGGQLCPFFYFCIKFVL